MSRSVGTSDKVAEDSIAKAPPPSQEILKLLEPPQPREIQRRETDPELLTVLMDAAEGPDFVRVGVREFYLSNSDYRPDLMGILQAAIRAPKEIREHELCNDPDTQLAFGWLCVYFLVCVRKEQLSRASAPYDYPTIGQMIEEVIAVHHRSRR